MNRRTFFAGLLALPASAAAAVKMFACRPEYYWQVNSGYPAMLEKCGKVVEKHEPDLDEILNRIYALKSKHTNRPPEIVFAVSQEKLDRLQAEVGNAFRRRRASL